ncbi:MAG: calcium-binding protein [Pirellulales bacterium]
MNAVTSLASHRLQADHSSWSANRRRKSPAARRRQLFVEQLEDRSLLAANLLSALFIGGAGDQRGTDLVVDSGMAYVVGNGPEAQSPADNAIIARLSLPTSGTGAAATDWTANWSQGNLFGATVANGGLYGVGWSYPGQGITTDGVGGSEVKSVVAKISTTSGGVNWATAVPVAFNSSSGTDYFVYGGVESHNRVVSATIGGTPYLLVAGGGQPWSYSSLILAKYDLNGNLIQATPDVVAGYSFQTYNSASGGSGGYDVVEFNGNVFLAGTAGIPAGYGDATARPTLWKFDSNLVYQSYSRDLGLTGELRGLAVEGNKIYAVGATAGANADLIVKRFDANGNLEATNVVNLGGNDMFKDVVSLNGKLYATGSTNVGGNDDLILVEIDPATLTMSAPVAFGGANAEMGSAITTDGTRLYVVGESRSFAYGGNAVGQNDIVLLTFDLPSTQVSVSGGQMLVQDISSGGKDDSLTITYSSSLGLLYVQDPVNCITAGVGATAVDSHTVSVPLASVSSILVDTLAGQDKLTLDYSTGNFALPVTFDAGTEFDGLVIQGGAFTNVTFNYDSAIANPNVQSGTITQDGTTISYTGLEPIAYQATSVANYVFNLPGTGDNAVLGDDAPLPSQIGMLRLSSTAGTPTFEMTDFVVPTGSALINLGGDSAVFNVAAGFAGETVGASFVIDGQAGGDSITVDSTILTGLTLRGGLGDDTLVGGGGADLLEGGGGDDTLNGGAGDDTVEGGAGNDLLQATGAEALNDVMVGGPGAAGDASDYDVLKNIGAGDVVLGGFNSFFDVFTNSIDEYDGGAANLLGDGNANLLHLGFTRIVNTLGVDSGAGPDDVTTSHANATTSPVAYLGGDTLANDPTDNGDHVTIVLTPNQLGAIAATWADVLALQAYLAHPTNATLTVTAAVAKGNLTAANFESASLAIYDDHVIVDITPCFMGITSITQIQIGSDSAADTLVGTSLNDLIFGQGGDDVIDGAAGNDCIFGGAGADSLVGGIGGDKLFGGSGADQLSGGAGNDQLYGGGGDDVVYGGADEDWIYGGGGDDSLFGELGHDRLLGEAGADRLSGGPDNDTLDGGLGDDSVYGDAGSDKIQIRGGEASNDLIRGGTEFDDLEIIALTGPAALPGFSVATNEVERILGNGQGLLGNDQPNVFDLRGLTFTTLSPLAYVNGMEGNDVLYGSEFNDELIGGGDVDSIYGYGGADTLTGNDGDDVIYGGNGNDVINGGQGADFISAEGGNDVIEVAGADMLNDTGPSGFVNGGANTDRIRNVGTGPLVLRNFAGVTQAIEYLEGAGFGILGTVAQTNVLDFRTAVGATDIYSSSTVVFVNVAFVDGLSGDDVIYGTNGVDLLYGGGGADRLYGMHGDDTLYGGAGDDTLNGGSGIDRLYGDAGVDTLTGGAQNDYFVFEDVSTEKDVVTDFVYDFIVLSWYNAPPQSYGVSYASVYFDPTTKELRFNVPGTLYKTIGLTGVLSKPAATRFVF